MTANKIESFGILPLHQEGGIWKILLIKHIGAGHWGFPKGRKNHQGETPLEAAIRELKEETGLDVVTLLQESPIIETYTFTRQGKLIEKSVSYFPALVSGNLKLQEEEIADAGWFELDAANKQLSFKEGKATLSQLIKQCGLC